jgi:MFS family permease
VSRVDAGPAGPRFLNALLNDHFPAMRQPGYRLLWYGQTGSALGDAALPVAIAAAGLTLHGSASVIGFTIAASRGTQALFSLIGGSWADRRDRRVSMLTTDLVRALVQAGTGVALVLGAVSVWMLPAGAAICGSAAAFFRASAIGLTPEVVAPDVLRSANGLMALSRRGAVAAGPLAAAGAIALAGPGGAYLIDAASFALSALCIARISGVARARRDARRPGMWRDIVSGGRVVLTTRWLLASEVVFGVANLTVGAFYVAGPLVAWQRFGGPISWSIILTGWGLGGIVGGLASLKYHPKNTVRAIWLLSLPSAVQLLALAWVANVFLIAVVAAIGMATTIAANTLFLTALQKGLESNVLGRVTSYDWLVSLGGMCAGLLVVAPLTHALRVSGALTLLAASVIAITLALLCFQAVTKSPLSISGPAKKEQ